MIAFQRTLDAVNFCLQSQLDMMELQIPAYSGPHLPELASKSMAGIGAVFGMI